MRRLRKPKDRKPQDSRRIHDLSGLEIRHLLGNRDGWICCWCKRLLLPEGSRHTRAGAATIEHVIPRNKGGSHSWDNLALACFECNQRRGDNLGPPPEAKETPSQMRIRAGELMREAAHLQQKADAIEAGLKVRLST